MQELTPGQRILGMTVRVSGSVIVVVLAAAMLAPGVWGPWSIGAALAVALGLPVAALRHALQSRGLAAVKTEAQE